MDWKTLVGIYLWKSREAADAFYTTQWLAMVMAVSATKTEWSTPMVVESEQGWRAVVTARDPSKVADSAIDYDNRALVLPLDVTRRRHIRCRLI